MSIIDGKATGAVDDFERLKLVATLAAMIYADPNSEVDFSTAVALARGIIAAADDSLQQNPDLRLANEDEVK